MDGLVKAHVYEAIQRSKLVLDPFPHIQVSEVFPKDFYEKLLLSLPPDEDYKTYPHPYEQRRFIQLSASTTKALSQNATVFWQEFEAWLHSQEFLDVMATKFSKDLPINHVHREKDIQTHAVAGERVRVSPRSLLVRDYENFALGPHTDAENKFIVGALYFPKDDSLKEFGTSIYTPKQPGYRMWKSPHLHHDDFNLVRTIENRPNSFFVFMKTDNSWHGVEKKKHSNVGRDVLFWIPQIGNAPGAEHELSLPQRLFKEPSFINRLARRVMKIAA